MPMNCCTSYSDPDIIQTPGESIAYTIDWPSRGLPSEATISSTSFSPTGTTDYAISNEEVTDDGLNVVFQLTGGIPGTTYSITNSIVLSDGEIMQATLVYECVLQNLRRQNTCI